MLENTEDEPEVLPAVRVPAPALNEPPLPPPPIVTVYVVPAVTANPDAVLKPPAPPPPPPALLPAFVPPPPPATTTYSTVGGFIGPPDVNPKLLVFTAPRALTIGDIILSPYTNLV